MAITVILHDGVGIVTPFQIEKLVDDQAGLSIEIQSTRGSFELMFDSPYGYRNFDEGDLVKYLRRENAARSGFYQLFNSEFLGWAASENSFEEIPTGLKHYAIVSSDDVVEVLSFEPPGIRAIEKG